LSENKQEGFGVLSKRDWKASLDGSNKISSMTKGTEKFADGAVCSGSFEGDVMQGYGGLFGQLVKI
jgi:hypothetical protein